jgi:hypothetical protein
MKYLKRFENYNDTRDIEDDLLVIKDILTDLEDDHEINFDTYIGKFFSEDSSVRSVWGSVPVRGGIHANSININLGLLDAHLGEEEAGKYFIFNEQILPTINTIKSHLEEVNIVIFKIKGVDDYYDDLDSFVYDSSKNDYYPLDEFIKKYGSDEFNELEIILY